jgi:cytochrome P450
MGDLCFAESLQMLEGSDYSPWVKVIFEGIKSNTKLRSFKMLSRFTNYIIERFLLNSEYVRAKQLEHWNYSKERVDRRLERSPDRPDLWTKILEKGDPDDAGGLSLGEHHSTASLFMLAGTETTATALSGTTYHLLMNPDKINLLQKEIRSAFTSLDDMTLESLARQKYLMAVLQEGLRMYPPVPAELPRKVPVGGATICGEWLPEGTTLGVHHLATYRNEKFFRKAGEFHPERWLGDAEFKDDRLDALEPFSVGPRNCLGKNLAWHEMRLLLATVMLHFDMKLCEESKDWNDQKVFLLWEKKPLVVALTPAKA